MCDGKYTKDPVFAAPHQKMRYVRSKASYFLRGRYRRIGGKNCVYCGFKAQTGDHVPALFLGFIEGVVNGVVVSSCYDCNKFLGSFSSTCLKDRTAFLSSTYDEGLVQSSVFSGDPKDEPLWRERVDAYKLKAERCKGRMNAINCNMLKGSAALFAENGEYGGETTSYDSFEKPQRDSKQLEP